MLEPVQSVREFFEREVSERLKARPDVVAKVGAVYQFNVAGGGGGAWSIDCSSPGGLVSAGTAPNAQCTVSLADADLLKLAAGKLNVQVAFMTGKIKVQGDMGLALKLQQLLW
jgi:hypothetical protein